MNSVIKEKSYLPKISKGLVLQPGHHLEAKVGIEYVMTLIDCYVEEHRNNIEFKMAPVSGDSHLTIRKRSCRLPLSTQPLPVQIVLDNKFGDGYRYLTVERGNKLARAVAELLLEDAMLCRCSNQDCSSYSEVMTIFEAEARVAFDRWHHRFDVGLPQYPVSDNGENTMEKRSTRRWWKPVCWLWPIKAAVDSKHKHYDRKSKKPAIMPKRMQVKYLKKH